MKKLSRLEAFFLNNKYIILMLAIMTIYIIILRLIFGIIPETFEIISITMGVICLDLLRRQNSLAFISNILFSAMLIFWFVSIGLFGQVVMRTSMLIINAFGLYFWLRPKGENKELIPSWLSKKFQFCIYSGILILPISILLLYGLKESMDWTYSVLVLTGYAMMSKKKIDSWILWLISDVFFGIPLFLISGSWMNVLFCIFLITSEIAAIKQWSKSSR